MNARPTGIFDVGVVPLDQDSPPLGSPQQRQPADRTIRPLRRSPPAAPGSARTTARSSPPRTGLCCNPSAPPTRRPPRRKSSARSNLDGRLGIASGSTSRPESRGGPGAFQNANTTWKIGLRLRSPLRPQVSTSCSNGTSWWSYAVQRPADRTLDSSSRKSGRPTRSTPQDQRVDEGADQRPPASARSRPATGDPDHQVLAGRCAAQQHLERRQQRHEQRRVRLAGRGPELGRQAGRRANRTGRAAVGQDGRPGPVSGHSSAARPAELRSPVRQLPLQRGALQPLPLPRGVVRVLHRQPRPAAGTPLRSAVKPRASSAENTSSDQPSLTMWCIVSSSTCSLAEPQKARRTAAPRRGRRAVGLRGIAAGTPPRASPAGRPFRSSTGSSNRAGRRTCCVGRPAAPGNVVRSTSCRARSTSRASTQRSRRRRRVPADGRRPGCCRRAAGPRAGRGTRAAAGRTTGARVPARPAEPAAAGRRPSPIARRLDPRGQPRDGGAFERPRSGTSTSNAVAHPRDEPVASSESPPRSKKLSWMPTRSRPRTSCQIAARSASDWRARGRVRPAAVAAARSGGGQRLAVHLAVGRQRQRSSITKAAGTM